MELNLSKPIAFFDLETTGIRVATDKIVEIAIIKINPDGTNETKTDRINPGIPIPEEVSEIHGIYDFDVKDSPSFKDVAIDYNNFLMNCDLAGYNSNKFDIPLLVEEFLRADVDFDLRGRRFVDVQNIFHKMEQRTLSAAYKFYCDKELIDAHSATADTQATLEILKAQLDMYDGAEFKNKQGEVSKPVVNDIKALHDFSFINRNVDLIGHIVFNDKDQEVFNFGKHKGKTVEEVFTKEPSYYKWMMNAEFPRSTKKVITAIKLRNFNKGSINFGQ